MRKPVARLKDVSFEYRANAQTFSALQGVDLEIQRGEFVAITGPSGSGKSTLLNLLGLLAQPSSGELELFNRRLQDLSADDVATIRNENIGFVFQNFSLVSRLSALENILLPVTFSEHTEPEAYAQHRERALRLLNRFGLGSLSERRPNELSGGQKQRVAICRALILNPTLILADEPTGALDSQSASEVMKILTELHKEGQTIVVITHDHEVATQAQRIIQVRDGRIVPNPNPGIESSKEHSEATLSQRRTTSSKQNWASKIKTLQQSMLLAKRSLLTHRTRSTLTGLGLFIGILSLIVIDGLGVIVQNSFNKLFYTSSIRKAYIYYDEDRAGFHGRRNSTWRGLHATEEFPKLAQMFEKKGTIRPFLRTSTCQIKTESGGVRTRLVGLSDRNELLEMDTPMSVGRFLNESEMTQGAAVAIIGFDTLDQLFDKTDPRRKEKNFPMGQRLAVDNCNTLGTYTIIGILGKRDTSFGNRDANDVIYVPTQTLLNRMGPTYYTWFSVLPKSDIDTRTLAAEVTNFLSLQSGGRLTFGSSIPADILDRIRGFLTIVQSIVGFIGLLCLFVGGVGIMNMMLVTVAERTREIGLMKSLGAKQSYIRGYILTESTLLCFIAGVAAIAAGLIANNLFSFLVSHFVPALKDFNWVFAPLGLGSGLLVSFLCGIGFGSLPASRAAALDPAECLRAE